MLESSEYDSKKKKMEQGIQMFLEAMDLDLKDQHLKGTPERVARAWLEEFGAGNFVSEEDIKKILSIDFAEKCDEMIVLKDISFTSHCIHHMVEFTGIAKVGYVPDKRVVGLSKLARIVDVYAKRLQIQERLTRQVAEAIKKHVKPLGVGVVIQAQHNCVACRGAFKPGSKMITSCLLGKMREDKAMRQEFLSF